jgi:hypothetical protein
MVKHLFEVLVQGFDTLVSNKKQEVDRGLIERLLPTDT